MVAGIISCVWVCEVLRDCPGPDAIALIWYLMEGP